MSLLFNLILSSRLTKRIIVQLASHGRQGYDELHVIRRISVEGGSRLNDHIRNPTVENIMKKEAKTKILSLRTDKLTGTKYTICILLNDQRGTPLTLFE